MNVNEETETPVLPSTEKREAFTNPYTTNKEATADCVTITCSVSKDSYNFIRCIRPSWGTNASVIGLLWKKLCNELNKRNITDVSSITEFEQFVTKCHIVGDEEYRRGRFSDGPTNGTLQDATSSNVGPGTTPACDDVKTAPSISANLQSGVGEKRGGGRQGKKGKGSGKENNE